MLAASRQWAGWLLLVSSVIISRANALVITAANSSSVSTRSTDIPPIITSAPGIAEPFQVNTCSYYNATESRTLWNDPWCSMYVGTVDLVFWPTTGNHSYPSTYRDTVSDYTFTSPSVYMIVNTMYGSNACGPLGPSASREIFAFDLTEVSTLVPYTDDIANTRRETRQLYLSDLDTHCTRSFNRSELATQTRPVKGDDTRCNPFLTVPKKFKEYGYPYWLHCGIKDNKFGIFDPPYAIPAVDELVPARTTTAEKPDTDKPTAVPSATAKPPPSAGSLETATASQHKTDPAPGGSSGDKPTANPGNPQSTVVGTANAGRPSTHQAGAGDIASPAGPGASDHSSILQVTQVNNAKPTNVDPANTKAIHSPGDNNAEAGDGLSASRGSLGNSDNSEPNPVGPVITKAVDNSGDNSAGPSDSPGASEVTRGHPNSAAVTPVGPMGTEAIYGPGNNNAEAGNSPAASQVSQGNPNDSKPTNEGPMNTKAVDSSGDSNDSHREDGGQDILSHHGNPEAMPTTAGHARHSGPGENLQSAVDSSNTDGPAIIPSMESDSTTIFDGVASTVANQVVSLGTAGLEVVNKDTGETSTYAVPAAGASQSDGGLIPASIAVYNGHTLERGGPAVTVTNAVVMTPYPASPTKNPETSVNTASLDKSSSAVSAVRNSSAHKVTQGTYVIVLALVAYGWVYL
ncbi:hypothetical protein FIE12Z_7354 [Fusarium flagelliforme]|uniref:Uncharacterized protein n=1 Tax=Fusarium flagelliforme TaxID=2675880 RepID=A0A395MKI2_9HYPO|nr:hypothetical protein FIE12Z_7354 [Fusarium flagelliforme]